MILLSNLVEANRNLLRNKLRSFLTILAIMVGSFSIIVSLAIQTGARTFIDDEFNAIGGDNIMNIYRADIEDSLAAELGGEITEFKEGQNGLEGTSITAKQIEQVKQIDGVKAETVKPYQQPNVDYITTENSDKKFNINVDCMASESINIELSSGQKLDYKADENQIILPSGYAEKFGYENENAIIGQNIQLGVALPDAQTLAIINAQNQASEKTEAEPKADTTINLDENEEETEKDENESSDSTNITTQTQNSTKQNKEYTTITARVVGVRKDAVIAYSSGAAIANDKLAKAIQAENNKSIPDSDKELVFALQAEYKDGADTDNIMAELEKIELIGTTKNDLIEGTHSFLDVLTIILYIFGGIALLVAAIGIINTLLMSVQERTKEIGLNKAIGMSSIRVFNIFSLESILLGLWGSALGTAIAIVVGKVADQILHRDGMLLEDFTDFHIVKFTVFNIILVIAIVMLIAFIAGTLPALRAAKKNPIDALRYE